MFITREPPQNHPPSPHPSPPLPPRSAEAVALQSGFQLSPHPPAAGAARRLPGVRLRGRGGGGGAGGLEKAGATGSGGGVGARAESTLSSQRVPAPAPARLSHVRAKNPLQSLLPARGRPPPGRPSDPRTPAHTHPAPRHAGRQPGPRPCEETGRAEARGRSPRRPRSPERPPGVRGPLSLLLPPPPPPNPPPPPGENEWNTKFAASATLWPSELTIVWARIDPRSGLGSG